MIKTQYSVLKIKMWVMVAIVLLVGFIGGWQVKKMQTSETPEKTPYNLERSLGDDEDK